MQQSPILVCDNKVPVEQSDSKVGVNFWAHYSRVTGSSLVLLLRKNRKSFFFSNAQPLFSILGGKVPAVPCSLNSMVKRNLVLKT